MQDFYVNQTPLSYEIKTQKEEIAQSQMKLDFFRTYVGTLDMLCHQVQDALRWKNMVQLPRMWYGTDWGKKTKNWARDNAMPTLLVNGTRCLLRAQRDAEDPSGIPQVLIGKGIIYVTSEPSWEVWYRWSSIVVEQFFEGMLRVRNAFEAPAMKDISVVETEYDWQTLAMHYETATPVHRVTRRFPEPIRYCGELYPDQTVEFFLSFKLELPNPPSGVTTMNGCRVTEEQVTQTTTRKKKRIICGE